MEDHDLPTSAEVTTVSNTITRITFCEQYDLIKFPSSHNIHFLVCHDNFTTTQVSKRSKKPPIVYCENWPLSWKRVGKNVAGRNIIQCSTNEEYNMLEKYFLIKNKDINHDDTSITVSDANHSLQRIHLQLFEEGSWDHTYTVSTIVWCLRRLLLKPNVSPIGVACDVLGGTAAVDTNVQINIPKVLKWSIYEHHEQGYRDSMEDTSFVSEFDGYLFCGIADGHGGSGAAKYVAKHLPM